MKQLRILSLIVLIGVVSCETEELADTVIDNAADNTEIISTVNLEIEIDEADAIFDDISLFVPFNGFSNEKNPSPTLSKNDEDEEDDKFGPYKDCFDFEFTGTDNSFTFTLTFTGECEDRNGNPITGTIIRTVTYTENSFEGSTTIDNFVINGYVINGTRTFVRTKNNENGNPQVSTTVDIVFETEENTISKVGERTVELTEGGDTITREDDVKTITGFFEYMTPERSFSVEITTPLVLPTACGYIVSGVKTYTTSEGTSTLDYGDGTCDNLALLTLPDGSQEEITLRERKGDFDNKNEDGEDGENGDGEDGENGEDGEDESDGEDGEDESDGEDGSNGEDGEETQGNLELINEYLVAGTWEVTQYIEKTGVGAENRLDLTQDFVEFVFDFNASGQVMVSQNGNVVFEAPWAATEDDNGFFVDLDFEASTNSTLRLLNNSWGLSSVTETRIGSVIGNLDTENGIDDRIFLTFERI